MERRIAKFGKVSLNQFKEAMADIRPNEEVGDMLATIPLPVRSTKGSAGYDFKSPFDFVLQPGESIVIPTGIRCYIEEGWVLVCMPRSGMGFKYQVRLANSLGIIDEDYYYSDNEGHIKLKLVNGGDKTLEVKQGDGIAQGLFFQYGITIDDDVDTVRNGGFGSTGR